MRKFLMLSCVLAGVLASGAAAWAQSMGGPPGGGPPSGGRPGGQRGAKPENTSPLRPAPPQIALAQKLNGLLTLSGESLTISGKAMAALKPDQSVILLMRAAELHVSNADLTTDLAVSSLPDAQSGGLGAAVLVMTQSKLFISGGTVTTRQAAAAGVYVSDFGSSADLQTTRVATHNSYAPGVVVTGGELTAQESEIVTESDNAPAVDLRLGRVRLTGGRLTAAGPLSPAIAASGHVEASDVILLSQRAAAIDLAGPHRLDLKAAQLTAGAEGIRVIAGLPGRPAGGSERGGPQPGVHIAGVHMAGGAAPGAGYGPARPDTGGQRLVTAAGLEAPPSRASIALSGGSISARGAVFTLSGTQADIALSGAALESASGQLIRVSAVNVVDQGLTGGQVRITASGQVLNGDIITDAVSSAVLELKDGSRLSGRTTANVDVTLASGSTWDLTADSKVGKLNLSGDVDDGRIDSVIGNGHSLAYEPGRNPELGGRTYDLSGGGQLMPLQP